MAAEVLGKRKRRTPSHVTNKDEQDSSDEDMRARFQKAFEAKFKPLPQSIKTAKAITPKEISENNEGADDDDDESDWEGISSGEDEIVEVINHRSEHDIDREEQKREMKAFMVYRFQYHIIIFQTLTCFPVFKTSLVNRRPLCYNSKAEKTCLKRRRR